MKRTIVKEGRRASDGGTPSGAATPDTQKAGSGPQTIEEERRGSTSDVEKGLNESEDGTVDVRDEKICKVGGGYVEKG